MIKSFFYKIIAMIFLIIIFGLALIILHFYLARAEIIIKTEQEEVSTDFTEIINILPQEEIKIEELEKKSNISDELLELREAILGKPKYDESAEIDAKAEEQQDTAQTYQLSAKYYEAIREDTYNFVPTGESEEIIGKSQGIVIIINNSSRSQPLVATTRLLTSEGVLFRIKKGINVPPGGKIEVQAEADKLGASGDIGPTIFTIPGLSQSLQKLIYAESKNSFSGGVKVLRKVSTADLDNAQKIAVETLENKTLIDFNKKDSLITLNDIFSEVLDFQAKAKAGDALENFSGKIKVKISALSFDKHKLRKKAESMLIQSQPEKSLMAIQEDSLTYKIIKIDSLAKTAELKINIRGYFNLENSDSLIKPESLVGLSAREAQDKILTNKSVSGVIVRFSPFWVNRVPRMIKNIKIVIKTE